MAGASGLACVATSLIRMSVHSIDGLVGRVSPHAGVTHELLAGLREMADMIARDIEGIEAAQRAFVAEAEAALLLTTDTSRTTIPAKALWASAHLTDKLTVQNALFPEGILYRTDIRFFEPPDNDLQAMVFRILLANVGEPDWEEIENGRGERI